MEERKEGEPHHTMVNHLMEPLSEGDAWRVCPSTTTS